MQLKLKILTDFIVFLFVAAISFAGSVQVGSVNLAVVEATLTRSFSAGILVAIGGSIPEFIYSFVALKGFFFLQQNPSVIAALNVSIIPIFLTLGLIYLFQKQAKLIAFNADFNTNNFDFVRGFALGMLNPQLLPFWFFMLIYINKLFIIKVLSSEIAFVLGTGVGAFGMLFVFARLALRFQGSLQKLLQRFPINRIMGWVFIAMALFQLIKIFV